MMNEPLNLGRFGGRVAIVTGAANGIGRACALRLAQEGAQVACVDIEAEANKRVAAECRQLGTETLAILCDVREPEAVKQTVAALRAAWSRVDILVTSAGVYSGASLPEVTQENWQRTIQTNLTGIFLCNQAVAEVMKQQRSGSIINISSMAGKTSFPATAEYSASKSGIIGLTRSVAMELAPYGVTANTVCPGNTQTRMLEQVAEVVAPTIGQTPTEWLAMRANDCPLGRFAKPWEIAGVVAFLASADARYITGQAIEVDGGMVLS